ncbi:MAG: hypothetical protein U7126_30700 [Microcoleus sp.]
MDLESGIISFPVASVLFKPSTANSQQSTVNSQQSTSPDGATGIDITSKPNSRMPPTSRQATP